MSRMLGLRSVRRQRGDACPSAPEVLYDAHASNLLALAHFLLSSAQEAEHVVAHVLREALAQPRARDYRTDRCNLAREVYLRATGARSGPRPDTEVVPNSHAAAGSRASSIIAADLSDQQRAVIALSVFGSHSHVQTADLLSLSTGVVDDLLRSGLHRVSDCR